MKTDKWTIGQTNKETNKQTWTNRNIDKTL